eukprot:6483039-Amphidinium_carterae.1
MKLKSIGHSDEGNKSLCLGCGCVLRKVFVSLFKFCGPGASRHTLLTKASAATCQDLLFLRSPVARCFHQPSCRLFRPHEQPSASYGLCA